MTSSVTVAEVWEELRSTTEVLSRFIDAMARRTAKAVGFSWLATPTAPSGYLELKAAYEASERTGSLLPVSSLYCDTVMYPRRTDNYKLRFWHDTLHVQTGLSFTAADELELGVHHTRIAEREGIAKGSLPWCLLRIDLLGQNYLMAVANRFPANQRTFGERCIRYGLDEAILMELHEA
jgi:hypothetical protein